MFQLPQAMRLSRANPSGLSRGRGHLISYDEQAQLVAESSGSLGRPVGRPLQGFHLISSWLQFV